MFKSVVVLPKLSIDSKIKQKKTSYSPLLLANGLDVPRLVYRKVEKVYVRPDGNI